MSSSSALRGDTQLYHLGLPENFRAIFLGGKDFMLSQFLPSLVLLILSVNFPGFNLYYAG